MKAEKKPPLPAICLGVAAALALALALFMVLAPNAPRMAAAPADPDTRLTLYDGPATMRTSQTATVTANGSPVFVYDVMVSHQHIWSDDMMPADTPMAYFDFEGTVELDITVPGLGRDIERAQVLPTSAGITPTVENNHVRFTVTQPGQYTVVYNDSVNKATHIFANPLETDVPDPDDPNVYYIGPGEWTIDAVALKSDQTLYLAGGAVLHTVVVANNAANVTIRGRGIIDGSDFPAHNQPGSYARVPIDLQSCKNVTAEGIILANSNCWNFNVLSSEKVNVSNVKIISGRQNGDGFTLQSCREVEISDSFARTWDDSLVLKNYAGSTRNITFRGIQIWTDLAQSMEIGYETNKGNALDAEIRDVLFEDITVLYNFHKPVISIHNSDDAYVHDITYRDIVVEHAFMQGDNGRNNELIEMTLQNSGWSTVTDEFGRIDNVLIDGLTVLDATDGRVPESRFAGQSAENQITNVTLRNVNILGKPITDLKSLKAGVNDFCAGITVE